MNIYEGILLGTALVTVSIFIGHFIARLVNTQPEPEFHPFRSAQEERDLADLDKAEE